LCVANVHSIRVLFDFTITSGHLSIFGDEIRGLFPSLPNSPILITDFQAKLIPSFVLSPVKTNLTQ